MLRVIKDFSNGAKIRLFLIKLRSNNPQDLGSGGKWVKCDSTSTTNLPTRDQATSVKKCRSVRLSKRAGSTLRRVVGCQHYLRKRMHCAMAPENRSSVGRSC